MAILGASLHGKQSAALAALLAQPSLAQAAKQAGVGQRTLIRWLQEDEAFQAAYRVARRQLVQHAIGQIQQATTTAVQTLLAVMRDPQASAGARVSAARVILEQALHATELEEIEQRLTLLEAQVAPRRGGRR